MKVATDTSTAPENLAAQSAGRTKFNISRIVAPTVLSKFRKSGRLCGSVSAAFRS
jgi:hypothetical protein